MTYRITKLTGSKNVPGRWYADVEGGETLCVTVETVADHSLYPGREMTEEEYGQLVRDAAVMNARARALRMLGARAMSRRELTDRLLAKGETEEAARAAADYLESMGFLDDARYAEGIVRHYSARGYGPGRVRQELYRRGVPKELWEAALEELPEDTGAIGALIDRQLRGKRPDRRELKRLTDSLLRRGFSWGDVRDALAGYDFSDFSEGYEDE